MRVYNYYANQLLCGEHEESRDGDGNELSFVACLSSFAHTACGQPVLPLDAFFSDPGAWTPDAAISACINKKCYHYYCMSVSHVIVLVYISDNTKFSYNLYVLLCLDIPRTNHACHADHNAFCHHTMYINTLLWLLNERCFYMKWKLYSHICVFSYTETTNNMKYICNIRYIIMIEC